MRLSPVMHLASVRALGPVAAILVAIAAVLAPGTAPSAAALGPLPTCRYDDILTAPRDYDDWRTTLVDTILRLPSTYAPPDLVPVSNAGIAGSGQIREVAIDDLAAMTAAAKANGTPIAVQSAYRSYAQQKITFQGWVNVDGYEGALRVSARPGHSEHQLGLAIDFKSADGGPPWTGTDWGVSPAGAWMKANAWKYGWLLSYPKSDFSTVCYSYEPWHYRYVGRDLAATIHASGLTTRAYLWAHFTTAIVPALPARSPAPSRSAAPSALPSLEPSGSVEPSVAPTVTPSTVPVTTSTPAAPAPVATAGSPGPPPVAAVDFLDPSNPAMIAAAGILLVVLVFALVRATRRVGRRRRSS